MEVRIQMPKKVLGRISCMGGHIMRRFDHTAEVASLYKAKTELMLRWLAGEPLPKADPLKQYMFRDDVWALVKEQENFCWINPSFKPDYIILDSFSDVKDQEFRNKIEGWSWCAVDTDMNMTPEFLSRYEMLPFPSSEEIEGSLDSLFSLIKTKYDVPVIYLHYTTKFERREEFADRGEGLIESLDKLSIKYPFVHSIHLPYEKVFQEKDGDPYHVNNETLYSYVELMNKLPIRIKDHE